MSAGRDNRVRGWRRDRGLAFELPAGRPSSVSTIALAPAAPFLVVADTNGGVNKFGFDGERQAKLGWEGGKPVEALAVAPGHETIAGSGPDGRVWRWGRDGEVQGAVLEAQGSVSALAWGPEGETLAVGTRPFQLWGPNGREWQHQH